MRLTLGGLRCTIRDLWIPMRLMLLLGILGDSRLSAEYDLMGLEGSGSQWHSLGLDLAWRAQSVADGTYNQLSHVTRHLSDKRFVEIYEIVTEEGRWTFAPTDLDRFGRPLGPAGAKRQADIERRVLTSLKTNATIEVRRVPQMTLYVQTDQGLLQSLDGERGVEKWTLALSDASRPVTALAANDEYGVMLIGTQLSVIKLADHKIFYQRSLKSVPSGGLAVVGDSVYVPYYQGGVDRFTLSDPGSYGLRMYSAGRIVVSPTVAGKYLCWPTSAGYLYVANGETHKLEFRAETRAPLISSATAGPDGRLFIGSSDGRVFAMRADSRSIDWEFMTGAEIYSSPMIFGDKLFAINALGKMFCLSVSEGELLWMTPGVREFAGATEDRVVVVNEQQQLLAYRMADGGLIGRAALGTLRVLFPNSLTDRIYLGDQFGEIQCLRPHGRPYPFVHQAVASSEESVRTSTEQAPEPSPPRARPKAPDDAKPATPPPKSPEAVEQDPFSGDDPFGGDDPFSTKDADPFGE